MVVNQDPEIFITDLEKLRWRLTDKFSVTIDDDDLISKIINSLPKEYDSLIDSFYIQMAAKGGLRVESFREKLQIKYQRLNRWQSGKKSKGNEQVLIANENNSDEKITLEKKKCKICKIKNHKTEDCRYKSKSEIRCSYCKKPWHTEDNCWKKERETRAKEKETKKNEKSDQKPEFMAMDIEQKIDEKDMWILYSGATQHMIRDEELLIETYEVNKKITMGNKTIENVVKDGKVRLELDNIVLVLTDVLYMEGLTCNIISVTRMLKKGFKIIGDQNSLTLTKCDTTIIEKNKFLTQNGFLFGLKVLNSNSLNLIGYDSLHKKLGHPGKVSTLETSTRIGLKVSTLEENIEKCEDLELAKSRRQNLLK